MDKKAGGIIFDLDGTLLDTMEDLAVSCEHSLAMHGFRLPPREEYRYFVGNGARMMIRRAAEYRHPGTDAPAALDADTVEKMCREVLEHYANNWDVKTRPYPGVEQVLDELAQKLVPLAVVSNKPQPFVREMVARYFPAISFTAVIGQVDGKPHKPDPSSSLGVAELMGLHPEQIVFVGDSSIDMATATAAGMLPVGVDWGFRPREELLEHGAALIIEDPAELIRLV